MAKNGTNGPRGEVLTGRLADRQGPQVHQVEMVAAELAQVSAVS